MNTIAARCPFCHTRIKISARLVGDLTPKTRCGSCLRLFDATQSAAIRARALSTDYALLSGEGLEPLESPELPFVEADSIEITAKPKRSWRYVARALGQIACLFLLLAALAAQYLWHNRHIYQHSPKLYPLYAQSCRMLSCSIPRFVDIAAFRGEALTVTSGSAGTNSLVVSFRLHNSAPLAQAPPVLILSFDTAARRSVALREFAPKEFLPASVNPSRALSAGERVNIRLELLDPGAEAVNYTVAFRAP